MHLMIVAELINLKVVDEVLVVPCGWRPDKKLVCSPQTRLSMVQKALKEFLGESFPVM